MTNPTRKRWFNYGVLACAAGFVALIAARGLAEAEQPLEGEQTAESTIER